MPGLVQFSDALSKESQAIGGTQSRMDSTTLAGPVRMLEVHQPAELPCQGPTVPHRFPGDHPLV